MPSKFKGKTYYHTKRRISAVRKIQRAWRKRKKGKARPTRALSLGYRGSPNQYRFIRETRPVVFDLADPASTGVTIIAGTGAIPNMAVFSFPDFSMDDLPGFSDFSALFANYRVDSIKTYLVPQWTQQNQPTINPLGAWTATATIPNLMITRVNTKYLPNGYVLKATAEENRDQLAQIMKKKRSLYGTRKWLKITTSKPQVFQEILETRAGVSDNLITRPSPWLPTVQAADQEFALNDLIFADRMDGTDFAVGLYKYRMYHRVSFRTSFVG